MVKKYKKNICRVFIFFLGVLFGLPVHVQIVFLQTDSPNQPSQNHLLADRIGCIDGFDSLL